MSGLLPNTGLSLMLRRFCASAMIVVLTWAVLVPPVQAVVFVNNDHAATNNTAPTGPYLDSGWQYLGYFGGFTGTAIGEQYFITAKHIDVASTTFSRNSIFTGQATQTYTIDFSANGGTGFWDISNSDLRIYKINETFDTYAQLYTGTGVGETAVLTGRGGPRGDAVLDGLGNVVGWEHTGADGVARWGTNIINTTVGSGAATLLVAAFNQTGTTYESGLSVGDSGSGMFIYQDGVWKLAGVNYSVDGYFDTNNVSYDNSHFSASMMDAGGFYVGRDGVGWNYITPNPLADIPSSSYFASISANISAIQAITTVPVPEPSGALLLAVAGLVLGRRKRWRRL